MSVLGVVAALGRVPLVDARLGDATLVEHAVALLEGVCSSVVVVRVADTSTGHDLLERLDAADLVVVHDPLCPLVPSSFVRSLVDQATGGPPVVAVRPVVDTIKATRDGIVVATVDRDTLRVVSSPVVARPADLLALGDPLTAIADPVLLAAGLQERSDARLVVAPAAGRRVEDASALRLLVSSTSPRPPASLRPAGPRET